MLTKHAINRKASLLFLINQRKEKEMNLNELTQKLSDALLPKYWRFVTERDGNCCEKCKRFDGKVFSDKDPAKPELPIHPNCRCTWEKTKFQIKQVSSASIVQRRTNIFNAKSLVQNNSTSRQRLYNLKDATITALEMKYLPTGIGEIIGGVKVASIAVTDYGIWAARARNVVLKSKKLNDDERDDIIAKIAEAFAKKDIRTILMIHEKYK